MSVRQILTSLVLSALLCGASSLAHAQSAAPKGAKDAAKPAPAAKPAAKPEAAAAAAAGGAVDAMMDQLWRAAPIDVLVNNAAATFLAQTEHLSFRAADAILGPTLHGTMYCTLAAGKRWIEGGHRGVVLSILSTSTITGRAFTVPSAMAKSAILAMTRSLAVEWGPKGVRTVAIAPGAFPTPGASGQLRPEGRDEGWAHRNPLGRAGEHSELANLASFLISDQAGYINGEMVVQDGGSHLRSSGAEDLLQWTDAQWQKQREGRAKG